MSHRLATICFLLAVLLLGGMSMSAQELPAYYKTTTDVAIRKKANPVSKNVFLVDKGETVVVSKIKTGKDGRPWGYCTDDKQSGQGWVRMMYLTYDKPAPIEAAPKEVKQWKQILLHTAHFLGYQQANVWWFYGCLFVVVMCLCFSFFLSFIKPYLSLLMHAIAILTAIVYFSQNYNELFWHVNWESVRWWSIVGTIMFFLFAYYIWELVKGFALGGKLYIGEKPLFAILCFVCSLGWLAVLVDFGANFFVEHIGLSTVLLFIFLPRPKKPRIYVEGEGYITGRGYNGGSKFLGDNGVRYYYDGKRWERM